MTNPSCQSDGLCSKKPPGSVWASKCMTPYMPEFDVCAQVANTDERSSVELAACDGSDAQSFVFLDNDTITPAAAADRFPKPPPIRNTEPIAINFSTPPEYKAPLNCIMGDRSGQSISYAKTAQVQFIRMQ